MKKLILITVCAFGLALAGSAATQTPAKKAPVKKEAAAPSKDVKKAKKATTKTEAATPATPATPTTAKPVK